MQRDATQRNATQRKRKRKRHATQRSAIRRKSFPKFFRNSSEIGGPGGVFWEATEVTPQRQDQATCRPHFEWIQGTLFPSWISETKCTVASSGRDIFRNFPLRPAGGG